MELLTTKAFNGVTLDCYKADNEGDGFWATREQIGQLLEYENPRVSVANIHNRNKERLDKFSTVIKLITEAGEREAVIYNFKGFLEICRFSNQPKADAVIDFAWNVMDEIRKTGNFSLKQGITSEEFTCAQKLLELAGIKDNQLVLALDKVYRYRTGYSMLGVTGTQLEAPTKDQLLTPTELGRLLDGKSARDINLLLSAMNYQVKVADKWEPLSLGMDYAIMIDTGKKHSDGTPVRQLKWRSNVIPQIRSFVSKNKRKLFRKVC